jgi:hypothetical protein
MAELGIFGTVILVAVGVILLLVFLGLFKLSRATRDVRLGRNVDKVRKQMKDPVAGTLAVIGINEPNPEYSWRMADITGVVSAPGLEPCPVRRTGLVSTRMWPKPGQVLPVIVDRAKPDFFVVEWVKVKPPEDVAWDEAQRLAAAMRSDAR